MSVDDLPPQRARLTIDTDSIAANWRAVGRQAAGAQAGAAVKADGYGVGMGDAARSLWQAGCRDFFIATLQEGAALRTCLPGAVIHLLNGIMPAEVEACLRLGLIPVLNDPSQLALWRQAGAGRACDVMVDTGIHRLGVRPETVLSDGLAGLNVDVLMSHLACADDPAHPHNAQQQQAFASVAGRLPARRRSLANSAGVALGAAYHFDLVRPGLALYGGNPQPGCARDYVPVVRVEAQVIQIAILNPGDTVGYSATWVAAQPSRIATLAIGYADGYLTRFSGVGRAVIGNHSVPVVGRVSMDLVTVDVSGVDAVAVGDWATLLGGAIPLEESAAAAGLNQYELLTTLGQRFERRYGAAT